MAKDANSKVDRYATNCPPKAQCVPQELVIKNVRLAAAYVPYQKLCSVFSPMEALKHGTVFPELYSPYSGKEKKHHRDFEE